MTGTTDARVAELEAENARLRELVKRGLSACNAAYGQALAEAQGHDRRAGAFDQTVHAWRTDAHAALAQPATRPDVTDGSQGPPGWVLAREGALDWAVSRWRDQVANRPLRNVHRAAMDGTWRQVIRHFGGDDEALIGPRHDDLVAAKPAAAIRSTQPDAPPVREPSAAMVTVPKEPTDRMTFVGQSMRYNSANSIGAIYRAMLDAAMERQRVIEGEK